MLINDVTCKFCGKHVVCYRFSKIKCRLRAASKRVLRNAVEKVSAFNEIYSMSDKHRMIFISSIRIIILSFTVKILTISL